MSENIATEIKKVLDRSFKLYEETTNFHILLLKELQESQKRLDKSKELWTSAKDTAQAFIDSVNEHSEE